MCISIDFWGFLLSHKLILPSPLPFSLFNFFLMLIFYLKKRFFSLCWVCCKSAFRPCFMMWTKRIIKLQDDFIAWTDWFICQRRRAGSLQIFVWFHTGWFWVVLSCFTFVAFTDAFIYLIHRGLHHRSVYRYLHKTHHTWKVPTPFASHAFHPVDGFLQSCPYHIYPFLFPLHKVCK